MKRRYASGHASRPIDCLDAFVWLKQRGWDLAPLTDSDYHAMSAIAHCWQLWVRSSDAGRRASIDAVATLLDGCQEIAWPMVRELIAWAGDWCHRDEVWPLVVERFEWRIRQRFGGALTDVADLARAARLGRCHDGVAQVQR